MNEPSSPGKIDDTAMVLIFLLNFEISKPKSIKKRSVIPNVNPYWSLLGLLLVIFVFTFRENFSKGRKPQRGIVGQGH
jgi:hypothetical protein